jgi:hypothetical protein
MLDTLHLPDNLILHAEDSCDEHSRWTALAMAGSPRPPTYEYKLDPGQAMTERNLKQWLGLVVRGHGYPIRVQWRRTGGDGHILLHDCMLWGDESESVESGFAAMIPAGAVEAPQVEIEAETPLERALKLVIENPERMAAAVAVMVKPFLDRGRDRDRELARMIAKEMDVNLRAAMEQSVASSMQRTLAQMYVEAGYELDEDGEPIDDDDETYPDEPAPRVEADAVIDVADNEDEEAEPVEVPANVVARIDTYTDRALDDGDEVVAVEVGT